MLLLPEHSVTSLNVIHHGDARRIMAGLPTSSVDLIFTDPPYPRKFLPLYGDLAAIAARVLRPGGWLLAMGGGMYADEILGMMSQHLDYHYTLEVALTGSATAALRPHGQHAPVVSRTKPIYAYAKGKRSTPRTVVYTPFSGDGNDKRFHHWGQDMKSARYFIDCFSDVGDLVVDPFCGGGTYPMVCQALDRFYIGIDTDAAAVNTTRARLRNPLYAPIADGQYVLQFAE